MYTYYKYKQLINILPTNYNKYKIFPILLLQ